jgi:hypothetical protein
VREKETADTKQTEEKVRRIRCFLSISLVYKLFYVVGHMKLY